MQGAGHQLHRQTEYTFEKKLIIVYGLLLNVFTAGSFCKINFTKGPCLEPLGTFMQGAGHQLHRQTEYRFEKKKLIIVYFYFKKKFIYF
jgi:hypothetical protein